LIQNKFLGLGDHLNSPYSLILQTTIAPAGYFKDHKRLAEYVDKAVYLPFLNNEKDHGKSNLNKKRFEQLNSIFMVKFKKDYIIHPLESSYFGQYNAEGIE
jgi:hypothetical protein